MLVCGREIEALILSKKVGFHLTVF
jgi:hypothetical protein